MEQVFPIGLMRRRVKIEFIVSGSRSHSSKLTIGAEFEGRMLSVNNDMGSIGAIANF